ncbi:MAG TPA: RNase adapter RapZ [Candidatus Nanopelagicales bacterium]
MTTERPAPAPAADAAGRRPAAVNFETEHRPHGLPGALGELEVLLVSGMSGAGRSSAARALEDLGWFVIDNLPPKMLAPTLQLLAERSDTDRVAVVVDVRGGRLFDELESALNEVIARGADLKILFLEASDEALVRRFESNRRPHPLQGPGRLLDALQRERALLGNLRATADRVVDTSNRSIHDLRRAIDAAFDSGEPVRLRATVMSFGFKYGLPMDADYVADLRFLPNPYWIPELRELRGTDGPVNDYVVSQEGAAEFLELYARVIDLATDGYLREGKRFATIAVGCTGGKHRSVAMAENLGARLVHAGLEVTVVHRDLGRE